MIFSANSTYRNDGETWSDNSFKIEQISAEFRVRPQKNQNKTTKQRNFCRSFAPVHWNGGQFVCLQLIEIEIIYLVYIFFRYWLFGIIRLIIQNLVGLFQLRKWSLFEPMVVLSFFSLSPEFVSNATRPNHECWNCWEYNAMKVKWKY